MVKFVLHSKSFHYMRLRSLLLFVIVFSFSCSSPAQKEDASTISQPTVIAFGSCAHEYEPVPAFDAIVADEPEIFIWLGDIVYGDTHDMSVLKQKYDKQKNKPEYQKLVESMPVIGVWDDHDFGINDGGRFYSQKDSSQQLFLDFIGAEEDDPRYQRQGLYSSYELMSNEKLIKIILLDTRYFRDTLDPDINTNQRYLPNPTGDILGEAQWDWLESELKNSQADFHIIGSGIQFAADQHFYEKWANFPASRVRMIELIEELKPKPLMFISGDRHIAEVSRMELDGYDFPVFDFTASGLTHTWGQYWQEENQYRVGELIVQKNYGLIKIAWAEGKPMVTFEVKGVQGEEYLKYTYNY